MKENLYLNLTGITLGIIFISFIYYCYLSGFRLFVITSGSMEPALKPGSLIITQPQLRYYPGQAITYYSAYASGDDQGFTNNNYHQDFILVTHRIVSSIKTNSQRSYITQGDANSYPDHNPVHQEMIIGRVWLVVPFFGTLLVWVYSRIGFYFLVLLPIILVILSQLQNIIKLLRHD